MAWDEWEQLKADVAERKSTPMQLNQHPADPGDGAPAGVGSEDLKSSKRAWVKAGEDTKRLDEPIGTALRKLEDGQAGLGETAGSQGAAAQKELYDSWSKYVKDVRTRCKSLGGLLQSSGHDLSKTDESLKSELDAIRRSYKDTEAVGGRAKGK
ncbi:hypothetical protein [Streptomyces sp. CC210A]|uniref:hypothetical protein n=1 Tax=Streptomyces sp. CC210A TaxID=2898184 RepID=UPI001F35DDDB|nr:hypothetical protein [Streptomyces sp. CC210A]